MAKAVDNLFQSIEVANMLSVVSDAPEEGDQIDLAPMIDELNQLSEMYALSISIREANNKRKAEKEKEGDEEGGENGEEEGGEDGGEEPSEPMNTAMYFDCDDEDDEHDEYVEV